MAKQFVISLCLLPVAMTRQQLNFLIRTHEAQRDFAKAYLDKHYFELEAKDQETEWVNRYLFHKRVVEELKQEAADDDEPTN